MFKFKPGFIQFVGAVSSGKTQLCIKLVNNASKCFAVPPEKIYLYYERWQSAYAELPAHVLTSQGMPEFFPDGEKQLFILDDIGDFSDNNTQLLRLASVHARHTDTYVFCIKHNLFGNGRYSRDMAVSTLYYILFENPRYSNQLSVLGRQLMPSKVNYFLDAYRKSINLYGYLVVDLTPRSSDRLVSDILAPSPAIFVEL